MGLGEGRGNFVALSPNKLWLCIAAIASIPLLAGAATAIETTIPDGLCVIRTAESVVLTDWPPGPDER